VLARLAREEGLARVGVIHINNDYGEGLAEAFVDSFEQRGGRVIRAVAYAPKQPSYRGELRGTARGAQALVLIGYPQDGITILRQAIEGGFYDRFLASDGLKSQSVIAALGAETLAGMRGTAPLATTDSPAHERFAAAYEARFGDLPADPYIDTAYDATLLLALAIEKAGTATDGAAVRGALREVARPPGVTVGPGEWARARALIAAGEAIDYQGAAGSQDFDAQGDVPGSYGVWEVRGGEIVNLRGIEPQAE